MKNIQNLKITKNYSLREALKIISDGAIKIALIVDKSNKLLGTLTDGDIRRGLLKGLSIDSSVKNVMSSNPTTVTKNNTNEEILKIALEKGLYQLPVVDKNKKILEIRLIDELIKPKEKNNKVILMVGGNGKRLMPLTKNNPKPMLNVGGKPILLDIVHKFSKHGYKNIIMCTYYKSNIIQNFFEDGSRFGVKIKYIKEEKKMGTAGALSLIKEKLKEPFFVMNGDLLTNIDFNQMLNFHHENKSFATMAVREYQTEIPYGVVKIKNSKATSILEKPINKYFVNAGIYLLDPKCAKLIQKNKQIDMPIFLNKIISKKKKVVCFPIPEYWLDIGKLNDYKKAQLDYLRETKL